MNRFTLQLIAIITMTIDHIAMILLPMSLTYSIFRLIGRIAFPLFCFLLAEGFRHTHNIKRYLARILLVGLAIEVALYFIHFFIADIGRSNFNIMITLFIGLLILSLLKSNHKWIRPLAIIPFAYLIMTCFFVPSITIGNYTLYLSVEYGLYGICLILLFGLFTNKTIYLLGFVIISLCFCNPGLFWHFNFNHLKLVSSGQHLALLTLPFIYLYNGKMGPKLPKIFTYLYYPLHLVVIYGFTLII